MTTTAVLIKRNIKLFFKDKGMFFTSLVTPTILLVLYATFLGNVYRDTFTAGLPQGVTLDEGIIDGLVGGQLISSILAVISPVKPATLSISYYIATFISTLIVCFVAAGVCLGYVAAVGWYMHVSDILYLLLDILLLSFFGTAGTALSSLINFFLNTQGQISAVGAIISAGYGFICGAYMPISSFSDGLQKAISFLPGTYGTSLVRNHALGGVFAEMEEQGIPLAVVDGMRNAIDCNLYFFDEKVQIGEMYLVLGISVVVLVGIYILLNMLKKKV